MKKLLLVLLLGLVAAGSYYVMTSPQLRGMIEREPPTVEFTTMPKGIGSAPEKVSLLLRDAGAGIRSVVVTVSQGETSKTVLSSTFDTPLQEQAIDVELPGRDSGFKEGAAALQVETHDASFWKNGAGSSAELLVDYARPKVEVLTLQHIGAQGGAEMVVFKASDGNLERTGARIGEVVTEAVPLGGLDQSFAGQADAYAVLFPIPLGFDHKSQPMEVFASDRAGNTTAVSVKFPVSPKKQAQVESKLTESFIRDKVFLIVPGFEAMSQRKVNLDVSTPQALADIFKAINQDYRRMLNEKIGALSKQSAKVWLWKDAFIKPLPSATSSTFGEQRRYTLDKLDAGGSRHDGLDLASVSNDQVAAAGDGKVLYSGELGIYGNAVIIDHGMELISLYGHLNSTMVDAGEEVKKGQKIGTTGETGLAGGDHLHFEFRISNIPVDPREWWDQHWVDDNVYGKLEFVKERLGMTTAQPTERGEGA